MIRDLSPFFAPRSIAVVGAGERATSSGGAVMQMLQRAAYGGRVVPVNPRGGNIFGYEAVTSIGAIDPPVDLAVIVIRPDAILDAVGECADRGIKNVLILPGGFAEAGPAGVARNEALLKLAAARGLTVAEPNGAGIVHLDPARLVRHRAGRESVAPARGSQGIRTLSAGAGQARADPLQLGRAGRDLRRPRGARGAESRRHDARRRRL